MKLLARTLIQATVVVALIPLMRGSVLASPAFASPFLASDAGSQPFSVAVGDLNGDGTPDLAVANYNTFSVSVLLGQGDGTFASRTQYPAGSGPYSIAI